METCITVDPHQKYTHATELQLLTSCGFLTQWILEAQDMHTDEEPVTMKDRLLANYVYFMREMNGELTPDGRFLYPGDEDLYAVVMFEFNGERVYIFEYAIVGIIYEDGSTWITRMD